jgi:hypothetical protein
MFSISFTNCRRNSWTRRIPWTLSCSGELNIQYIPFLFSSFPLPDLHAAIRCCRKPRHQIRHRNKQSLNIFGKWENWIGLDWGLWWGDNAYMTKPTWGSTSRAYLSHDLLWAPIADLNTLGEGYINDNYEYVSTGGGGTFSTSSNRFWNSLKLAASSIWLWGLAWSESHKLHVPHQLLQNSKETSRRNKEKKLAERLTFWWS